MVLKTPPECYGKHLVKEIGSPQDYSKNKESGNFPSSYDLRIPASRETDSNNANNLNEDDLAGALDDMGLSAQNNKPQERTYRPSNSLISASKVPDLPSEAFMPIKALN